jgi:hypothetical protein
MTVSTTGRSSGRPIWITVLGQKVELAYTSTVYSHRDGQEYPDEDQMPSGMCQVFETTRHKQLLSNVSG